MSEIVIIAAISENNVIGKNGKLPWHIAEDFRRLRSLTLNKPIIMGRKTFESIGKPLDKRTNVVITGQKDYKAEGIVIAHSFREALHMCRDYETVFVFGGESIFREALPVADRMEITHVHRNVDGDAYFPDVDWSQWKEISREDREGFSFVTYVRK